MIVCREIDLRLLQCRASLLDLRVRGDERRLRRPRVRIGCFEIRARDQLLIPTALAPGAASLRVVDVDLRPCHVGL
jgi:hypothetical protein